MSTVVLVRSILVGVLVTVVPVSLVTTEPFAHFAKGVGLEYNLGYVTDGFNNEHAKIICDYWDTMNSGRKPFYFEYITYKKGTDILTESQQYRLLLTYSTVVTRSTSRMIVGSHLRSLSTLTIPTVIE